MEVEPPQRDIRHGGVAALHEEDTEIGLKMGWEHIQCLQMRTVRDGNQWLLIKANFKAIL